MLVFTVLATLLWSSLIDARLARVDSTVALDQCQLQTECSNTALEINKDSFRPTVKPGGVNLRLAVEANQSLVFPVHPDDVTWDITRPDDKCKWEINSNTQSSASFRELLGSEENTLKLCDSNDLIFTVFANGTGIFVDAMAKSGKMCKQSSPEKLSVCEYALPDSVSIPGWDIWTLSVSASKSSDASSITLENAYVVYDAPEPPTTRSSVTAPNGADNDTASTHNPNKAAPDVEHSTMTLYIVSGVCGLIILILIIVVIVETIFIVKLKRELKTTKKEWVKKDDLAKKGKLDPDRTATVDRNCQPEDTCLQSNSKILADENKVAAAETAQKPAPAAGQPEQKSQPSQEVFNNAAAAGSGNQPASDPQKNA